MPIHRVQHTANYFVSQNAPYEDLGLSWEARGLHAYLMTKPDNWVPRIHDIVRQGPAGPRKVRGMLKELENGGYLSRERIRHGDGTFDWDIHLYELPYWDMPSGRKRKKRSGALRDRKSQVEGLPSRMDDQV